MSSQNNIKVFNNCKGGIVPTEPPPTEPPQRIFSASLSGAEQIPVNESSGTGSATFTLSPDGTKLTYSITLDDGVANVIGAHIHAGMLGVNGEVLLPLLGNPLIDAPGITVADDGVLVEGVATAASVAGAFAGDLAALVQAMKDGSTYVNIHTMTFPGGEIRGQLQQEQP